MKRHNSSHILCSNITKYRRCYTPIPTKFDTNVSSLLNLSSKVVAESIPYELIENRVPAIPDQLQHKIIFYSFPRKEEDIYIYSSYGSQDKSSDPNKKLSFYQGVTLLEKNLVQNVMQIGFHLNGTVQDNQKSGLISRKSDSLHSFYVSVTFDRCKITSVHCTCSHQGLFWCPHIVALALFRIRRPEYVQFREPISESLVRMDRDQLQKFAQYLIASHPNQVLSSAQNLVDQLLETDSKINQIYGAPDPTAGAGLAEPQPQWHLNESQIRDQLGHLLSAISVAELPSGLTAMTEKVREMLRVQDRNGARLLSLITDQGLRDHRLAIFKMRQAEMWPAYRDLWDELGRLWVCVVLCPWATSTDRQNWRRQLLEWSCQECCPPEDWDYGGNQANVPAANNNNHHHHNNGNNNSWNSWRPNTVFRLALIASDMSWDNAHLQEILSDKSGTAPFHVWSEQLPLSCLRVLALRSNGLHEEAVRLALSIARFVINQRQQQQQQQQQKPQSTKIPTVVPPTPTTPAAPPLSSTTASSSLSSSFNSLIQKYTSCSEPPVSESGHHKSPSVTSLCMMAAAASSAAPTQTVHPPPNFFSTHTGTSSTSVTTSASTTTTNTSQSSNSAIPESGWLGLVGNPIRVLVECLLSASTTVTSQQHKSPNNPPSYQHLPLTNLAPDLPDRSYLTLALRISLLALCQARTMPAMKHKQERCLNNEARLLDLLANLPKYDADLSYTLAKTLQAELALPYGSALSQYVPPNIYPMHTAGLFFFKWLLLFNQDLAYNLVRRAMRLPLLENHSDQHLDDESGSLLMFPPPQPPATMLPNYTGNVLSRRPLHLTSSIHHHNTRSATTLQSYNNTPTTHNNLTTTPTTITHQNTTSTTNSNTGRWPVLRRIENAQCELALHMITTARDSSQRLDQVLRICDRHMHSSTNLFKLSQDICSKCFMNAHLRCAVFHLSLNVAARTLRRSHWRRREMVSWLVSCAISVGGVGIAHLVAHWRHYLTAKEAVLQVASALLGLGGTSGTGTSPGTVAGSAGSHTAIGGIPGGPPQSASLATADERIRREVRRMAVEAAAKDPVHCGMRALSLMEKDPAMFETTYQAIYDAAERGAIGPPELFSLGRYLEPRHNWRYKAYQLAMLAVAMLPPLEPGDVCPIATDHDISWACLLAHSLGPEPLSDMLSQVVRKVRSPLLLAEVLHRCRHSPIRNTNINNNNTTKSTNNTNTATTNNSTNQPSKVFLSLTEPPLQLLLSATIEAFFTSTQLRLSNISPRHYTDFLDFLYKARDVFLLIVPDGPVKFRQLIDNIRQSHRGKRKLNLLLKERFLYDTTSITQSTQQHHQQSQHQTHQPPHLQHHLSHPHHHHHHHHQQHLPPPSSHHHHHPFTANIDSN